MTNKLYDVNYFIVVLDYYKELVGGGNKKAGFFFGEGAFTRVNISCFILRLGRRIRVSDVFPISMCCGWKFSIIT
jgi:hypothetical protein